MVGAFFNLVFRGLRHRPLRSWLTVLGIVIGIMLVVAILSISGGLKNIINRQLQMFGSDLLIILPGEETNVFLGLVGGQKFAYDDIKDLERIPGVKIAAPFDIGTLTAESNGEKKAVFVHSAPWTDLRPIFEESRGSMVVDGTWPKNETSNEVMLGFLAANNLFARKIRAGDEVIVQSKRLRVAGVFETTGNRDDDYSFYMSWDVFHLISGIKPGAMTAIVKVQPNQNMDLVARLIRFRLDKQKEVEAFTVLTPVRTMSIVGDIVGIVEMVLLIIAFVSLLVGAVGIMNTMYTSVLERTKQIGIMKAIGATREAILSLFLIESGVIGMIGGFLGVVLGLAVADGIGRVAEALGVHGLFFWSAVDYVGMAALLTFTFLVGIVAGFLPARTASLLEPAEALRYE